MSNFPACPQCTLENTYPDGSQYVCADCGHEWPMNGAAEESEDKVIRDANGNLLQDGDVVVLTADHGCDPTWSGTDHTREYIPVLFYGKPVKAGSVGRRETFADIGQSIAAYHGLPKLQYGTSFL